MITLEKMIINLKSIQEDIKTRTECEYFQIYDFDQTWGSTALGFPGIGGSAMTEARTYVLIPADEEKAYVYFGGTFAYETRINDRFREDLRKNRMAGCMECGRYLK